ncbi:hypothetical protein D3C72_1619180 [compost metagenome]
MELQHRACGRYATQAEGIELKRRRDHLVRRQGQVRYVEDKVRPVISAGRSAIRARDVVVVPHHMRIDIALPPPVGRVEHDVRHCGCGAHPGQQSRRRQHNTARELAACAREFGNSHPGPQRRVPEAAMCFVHGEKNLEMRGRMHQKWANRQETFIFVNNLFLTHHRN